MMKAVSGDRQPAGLRLDELARELPMAADVVGRRRRARLAACGTTRAPSSRAISSSRAAGANVDGARFVADAVGARRRRRCSAARGAVDAAAVARPGARRRRSGRRRSPTRPSAVYGHPSFALEVVGITGTNGKTTTAHLVRAAIDGALGRPSCGIARHRRPRVRRLARGRRAHDARGRRGRAGHGRDARARSDARRDGGLVARARSSAACARVRFRVAALTNLTQDHLDFHGSMAGVRRAKARLFTELGPGAAVLNVDDAFGRDARAARAGAARPRERAASRRGRRHRARARRASTRAASTATRAHARAATCALASRLVGAHNLENLAARPRHRARARARPRARRRGALARAGRARAARAVRRARATTSIVARRLRAHARRAGARARRRARRGAAARLVRLRLRRRPRSRPSARPWARRSAGAPTSPSSRTTTRAREDPEAIADAVVRRRARGGQGAHRRARPPEGDRLRGAFCLARATSSWSPARGTRTIRSSGTVKHPFDDRIEARRALASAPARAAGGA